MVSFDALPCCRRRPAACSRAPLKVDLTALLPLAPRSLAGRSVPNIAIRRRFRSTASSLLQPTQLPSRCPPPTLRLPSLCSPSTPARRPDGSGDKCEGRLADDCYPLNSSVFLLWLDDCYSLAQSLSAHPASASAAAALPCWRRRRFASARRIRPADGALSRRQCAATPTYAHPTSRRLRRPFPSTSSLPKTRRGNAGPVVDSFGAGAQR